MNKILVVDDDRDMQENIVEVLENAEFDVCTADNGEEAIELVSETPFDLVLLDLIMPKMGGMEALPIIRRKCPNIKIIMVTAFSTIDNAVEAMRKGANDYITKPFKINELMMAVKRCLEEAKFQECKHVLGMDETFNSLANSIRREILLIVNQEGKLKFMEICRKLEIEDHTKVNFHLKVLRESKLIKQDERKYYILSSAGKKSIDCFSIIKNGLLAKL
jgi:DNA-binding NtrC family response regulator